MLTDRRIALSMEALAEQDSQAVLSLQQFTDVIKCAMFSCRERELTSQHLIEAILLFCGSKNDRSHASILLMRS